MRLSTALLSATAIFALAALSSGCQVNKLDEYRNTIDTFELKAVVTGAVELQIEETPLSDGDGTISPSEAASTATEDYIIEGLRDRLGHAGDREQVTRALNGPMAQDIERGTSWRLVPATQEADAELVTIVEGYGLNVDALGRATVYFRLTVKGWHTATNALIYQRFSSYEAPLLDRTYGSGDPSLSLASDPVRFAAERATNLMMLNELGASEIQDRILFAATDAGLELAGNVIRDAF